MMEGPFDDEIAKSIDPQECVFTIRNDDSAQQSGYEDDDDDDIEVLTPSTAGHRPEPKLSLSAYESVRSLSASSEVTPTEHKSGDITRDAVNEVQDVISTHVETVVKIKQNPSGPSTSTPVRGDEDLNRAERQIGLSPVRVDGSRSESGRDQQGHLGVVSVDPFKIRVPLVGYEVMEQRDRFTVYKLHVHNGDRDNWFVFRRYTDFTQLQQKLKKLYPMFHLSLPPKRWFRDNYEQQFLEGRMHGLQAFVDGILRHRDLCNSLPVQEFFCFNDPPGPHDSVEESRAYCEELEDAVYNLKKVIHEKDSEIEILRDELNLYKSQVEMLTKALRDYNIGGATAVSNNIPSPASSLAECDLTAPEADQSYAATQSVKAQSKTLPDSVKPFEQTIPTVKGGKIRSVVSSSSSTNALANIQDKQTASKVKPGLSRKFASFDR